MFIRSTIVLLVGLLCLLDASSQETSFSSAAPQIDKQENQRIALIGGTLISRMEKYGYLETVLTVGWPDRNITFRNIGWPADDVLGTARGEFGSLRNTRSWRPPTEEEGVAYQVLLDHVADASPTTLIVGYGNEAAFAETNKDFSAFKENYKKLISAFGKTGARLILLTPTPHCRIQLPQETTTSNKRLEETSTFITQLAAEHAYKTVDLFGHFSRLDCANRQSNIFDKNGIHLGEQGYMELARFVTKELGIHPLKLRIEIDSTQDVGKVEGGQVSNIIQIKNGVRFDLQPDRLMAPWERVAITVASTEAPQQVKIDGVVRSEQAEAFAQTPTHDQFDEIRRLVIEKNQFHRDKMRPLNLAYIYLFRQHEMGHLSHEIEDLEELVEGHEQVIASLNKTQTHRYEIREQEGWKAPRDYPDHEVPLDVPAPNIAEELRSFTLAEGLEISLFSGDPLIANPINLNWDTRGRAWIATSSTYPHLKPGDKPNDRIVILEDRNKDGVADTAKVFAEGFLVPHSVMPVEGGAYVASTTEVLFLADRDGDDVADERRVVYDGFGNADVHHMIHGLRWAPWGDLHFIQSIYINSYVETAYGPRRLNGSGVWYFRPETERLEIYSRGMTNPWGFAFDRWGQSFGTDGAGGAGPHYAFPGAKHPTAVGAHRVLPGLIPGKPKNTAAEFVSGRHMPADWIGTLLSNDYRANRMVRYLLTEEGSGFTAEEGETVLHSSHRSFRPVDLKMGPDGAVYIVDWYNPIIDHGEVDFYHPLRDRSHGRIWRLSVKDSPLLEYPEVDGATLGHLFELLKSPEKYARELANRELATRPPGDVSAYLKQWVGTLDAKDPGYDHHRLEAGWLSLAINVPDLGLIDHLLSARSAQARAAAVRMAVKAGDADFALRRLETAIKDNHARVRLEAVNALRTLNSFEAANIALRALDRPTDDNLVFAMELTVRDLREHWVPAMLAGEEVFDGNQERLRFALLEVTDARVTAAILKNLEQNTFDEADKPRAIRLITSLGEADQVERVLHLSKSNPPLLKEMAASVTSSSASPVNAREVESFFSSEDLDVRNAALKLAGTWKAEALAPQITQLAETAKDVSERQAATDALAQLGALDELQSLMASGNAPGLRAASMASWGSIAPEEAAPEAVDMLAAIADEEITAPIISSFLSTDKGVVSLKAALESSELPENVALDGIRAVRTSGRYMGDMVDAFRQAGGLDKISQDMSPAQRRSLLSDVAERGDTNRGRIIYNRDILQCKNCHVVSGDGKNFGPDLSSLGAYMTPQSILESLLNPGTDIKQGYETVLVKKKDSSIVSGLLLRETEDATLIRMPGGTVVSISNNEIANIENSDYSLMPAGLTSVLRHDELVDLMHYLTTLGKQ